jgi:hypothetical protein
MIRCARPLMCCFARLMLSRILIGITRIPANVIRANGGISSGTTASPPSSSDLASASASASYSQFSYSSAEHGPHGLDWASVQVVPLRNATT